MIFKRQTFEDAASKGKVSIDYPIGHRNRGNEGMPVLLAKFESVMSGAFPVERVKQIIELTHNKEEFAKLPIYKFMI